MLAYTQPIRDTRAYRNANHKSNTSKRECRRDVREFSSPSRTSPLKCQVWARQPLAVCCACRAQTTTISAVEFAHRPISAVDVPLAATSRTSALGRTRRDAESAKRRLSVTEDDLVRLVAASGACSNNYSNATRYYCRVRAEESSTS
eukprot:710402-Pyramimonas_sp.AAC.1